MIPKRDFILRLTTLWLSSQAFEEERELELVIKTHTPVASVYSVGCCISFSFLSLL